MIKGKQETFIDIERCFVYHPPTPAQVTRYQELRAKSKEFAYVILDNTPPSEEQQKALDLLRDVVMWAKESIACNE